MATGLDVARPGKFRKNFPPDRFPPTSPAGILHSSMQLAEKSTAKTMWQNALRYLAALFFVGTGISHFRSPGFFEKIVPPGFGPPNTMVAISGIAEIAGGLGLLVPRLRNSAAWGLIALLVAVFPANIYMAFWPERIPGMNFARWMLWVRLPLQGVIIAWVAWAGLRRFENRTARGN